MLMSGGQISVEVYIDVMSEGQINIEVYIDVDVWGTDKCCSVY